MPSCVLKNCKNQSTAEKKAIGVTYHRFPRLTSKERQKWIKFVQKNRNDDTWLPSYYTLICSDHFKNEDKYVTKTGRLYLKKCALPYDDSEPKPDNQELIETISDTVSDTDSIFDTPRGIALKSKLTKEITAKKVIAKKLKKSLQQNRYLKKKCKSYKSKVKKLKIKYALDSQKDNHLVNEAELVQQHKSLIKKREQTHS